ncbi:MAG: hypothetical protein IT355_20620 [Gemmatimonadaceae bacterium]|nr:hypothetical protein [Gemmatimonadaceae bacterium]
MILQTSGKRNAIDEMRSYFCHAPHRHAKRPASACGQILLCMPFEGAFSATAQRLPENVSNDLWVRCTKCGSWNCFTLLEVGRPAASPLTAGVTARGTPSRVPGVAMSGAAARGPAYPLVVTACTAHAGSAPGDHRGP